MICSGVGSIMWVTSSKRIGMGNYKAYMPGQKGQDRLRGQRMTGPPDTGDAELTATAMRGRICFHSRGFGRTTGKDLN
jgi:hypothetical protein